MDIVVEFEVIGSPGKTNKSWSQFKGHFSPIRLIGK